MGMFDTIYNAPVKCPRCGDDDPKPIQIKCGPQILWEYEFGKDKIRVNWTYRYYGSIIDEDKKIIGGIATCKHCKIEASEVMDELITEAKNKKEIEPEDARFLAECKINGKSALKVMQNRLAAVYEGNRDIELFGVAITLDDNNVPIHAEVIEGYR